MRRIGPRLRLPGVLAGALVVGAGLVPAPPAGAATDPTTLVGQGGSFLQPVMSKLLTDDAPNLHPLFGAYTTTGLEAGLASLAGSGPGQFTADYAVTERPLTSAESSTALANGRTYAYVPFAATPVAIATLVPTNAWAISGSVSITASNFCQHMPMSTTLLAQVFGLDTPSPFLNWGDSRVTCPSSGGTTADPLPYSRWANLDPSMANFALMSLLDSTPATKALFDAGLALLGSLTTSDTPSENWPYSQNTIPGGDQPLIGKLLAINPETNAPSSVAAAWALGATGPISSVWTGSPLGVPWNLSTAAVQNAQGSYVAPSAASAKAAAADNTMASTSDPTTNNLVTFNASTTDAGAYNNFLMEESYLVVPITGLAPPKAAALAQLVRFVLGPQGQQDIAGFGAAPATPDMQTVGLKVAAQLSAEAVATTTTTTTTTTPDSSGSTTTTTPAAVAAATDAGTGTQGTGTGSSASDGTGSSSPGLAFTGASHVGALVGVGAGLLVAGSAFRRRLRRRGLHS